MNVIVSLCPNGRVVWITNQLIKVPYAGTASPAALIDILKKNQQCAPAGAYNSRGGNDDL